MADGDGRYQLPLYVTDGEIPRRMGVGQKAGRKALQQMRAHPRFPPQTIGGKRYWPSVVDFLDRWNGRGFALQSDQTAQQPSDGIIYRGGAWANLEAAKEQLSADMAVALDRDPQLKAHIADDESRLAKGGRRRPGFEAAVIRVAIRRLTPPGHKIPTVDLPHGPPKRKQPRV